MASRLWKLGRVVNDDTVKNQSPLVSRRPRRRHSLGSSRMLVRTLPAGTTATSSEEFEESPPETEVIVRTVETGTGTEVVHSAQDEACHLLQLATLQWNDNDSESHGETLGGKCIEKKGKFEKKSGKKQEKQGGRVSPRKRAAIDTLCQALSLTEGSEDVDLLPQILCRLISYHTHLNELDSAEPYLNQLEKISHPVPSDCWQPPSERLLRFLMRHEQWLWADQVASALPWSSVTNDLLARIALELGSNSTSDQAIPHLQRAQDLCPSKGHSDLHRSILAALVHAHAANGDYQQALECQTRYHQHLSSPQDLSRSYVNLAELHVAKGDAKSALRSLNEGLRRDDSHAPLLQAKAQILYQLGDANESLKVYQHLSTLMKDHPADLAKLYYAMGRICTKTKRYSLAIHYFQQELDITRKALGKHHLECCRIVHELARIYDEGLGDYDKALEHYQDALVVLQKQQRQQQQPSFSAEIHQQVRETQKCIGRIHYKRGEFQLAFTKVEGLAK